MSDPWGRDPAASYPAPQYPAPPYPVPAPLPQFPHAEPQEYHRILRTWNYAWWKPMLGILVVVISMVLVAPIVLLPVLAIGVAIEGGPFLESFENAITLTTVDPAALLYLNLVLGSMVLVTWFVIRVLHRMRPRWLSSVMPKLRWKFLFVCLGLAVVALLAQVLVSTLLPGDNESDLSGTLNHFTWTTVAFAIVVLLTTPLQAAGEEYVFRGYLLQAVGALFNKWVAIVVTAAVFALAHGGQNFPLFFDRFAFGFIAAWLVVKTGGLEAGIALHIVNNFLAFGFALTIGDLGESLTVSSISWWNIVLTLTQAGVYAVLVLWLARKMNLQTRSKPPVPAT